MSEIPRLTADPWTRLRNLTAARIALGRAGGSLPTAELLDFALAHAAARDAVHAELDVEALKRDVAPVGMPCVELSTTAPDRATYLQRPDLGRRLDEASRLRLADSARSTRHPALHGPNLALIVSDGLSAPAAQRQAPPLLAELVPMLRNSGVSLSPLFVVRRARVALEDEIGSGIGAQSALILIGERPGLGSPDSLGAYFVFGPRPGRTDAERNCVSNIRPAGLNFPEAAATLHYLVTEALRRRLSGVSLKDERALPGAAASAAAAPD
jgi:ethanolamine ammonia-lyase small subunit